MTQTPTPYADLAPTGVRLRETLAQVKDLGTSKELDLVLKAWSRSWDKCGLAPILPLLFSLSGKPFSLQGHFMMEPLYRLAGVPRVSVLLAGRQVSKSTTLGFQGVARSATLPYFNTLFVTPLFEQIRRFSQNYVKPAIDDSALGALMTEEGGTENVLQRTLNTTRSTMFFGYAFNNCDRLRGVSVNSVVYDECVKSDTAVAMADGKEKPLIDILVGDVVLAFTASNTVTTDRVVAVVPKGQRHVYRVTLSNGRSLCCTANERFWTSAGWSYLATLPGARDVLRDPARPGSRDAARGWVHGLDSDLVRAVSSQPLLQAGGVLPTQGGGSGSVCSVAAPAAEELWVRRDELRLHLAGESGLRVYTLDVLPSAPRDRTTAEDRDSRVVSGADLAGRSVLVHGRRQSEQPRLRRLLHPRVPQGAGRALGRPTDRYGGSGCCQPDPARPKGVLDHQAWPRQHAAPSGAHQAVPAWVYGLQSRSGTSPAGYVLTLRCRLPRRTRAVGSRVCVLRRPCVSGGPAGPRRTARPGVPAGSRGACSYQGRVQRKVPQQSRSQPRQVTRTGATASPRPRNARGRPTVTSSLQGPHEGRPCVRGQAEGRTAAVLRAAQAGPGAPQALPGVPASPPPRAGREAQEGLHCRGAGSCEAGTRRGPGTRQAGEEAGDQGAEVRHTGGTRSRESSQDREVSSAHPGLAPGQHPGPCAGCGPEGEEAAVLPGEPGAPVGGDQCPVRGLKAVDITSIEYVGVEEVWDLETERHHTFFANGIAVHNCQGMNMEFIPVINEAMSAREYRLEQYSGTPLTMDNPLESLWQTTSQAEWAIKCEGCGHTNLAGYQYDLMKMIGKTGLICAKCSKPLITQNGYWYHTIKDRRNTAVGYHLPQCIFPMHCQDEERWAALLKKRDGPNQFAFMTECLGVSWDSGAKLVTLTQLREAATLPWRNDFESFLRECSHARHQIRVLSIDWSGGGAKEESLTAFSILGLTHQGDVEVLWMKKYHHSADYMEDAARAIQAFKSGLCHYIVHDAAGQGIAREQILLNAGMPRDKIIPVAYVSAMAGKTMMRYNPPDHSNNRKTYSLVKNRSIAFVCELIKQGKLRFPDWESSQPCVRDFMALVEETMQTPRGSDIYLINKAQGIPDDMAHSITMGACALYYHTQQWPDLADTVKGISLRALAEADPSAADPVERKVRL